MATEFFRSEEFGFLKTALESLRDKTTKENCRKHEVSGPQYVTKTKICIRFYELHQQDLHRIADTRRIKYFKI
jgi:hypothetical protein